MDENKGSGSVEQPANAVPTAGGQTGTADVTAPSVGDKDAGKRFTQEEVNAMIKERLGQTYSKYGFDKAEELDEAIGKSQSYAVMKERYSASQTQMAELRAENALVKSDVDPSKYDDIRAYFKGKSLSIDADTLANEVKGHPEWARKAEPSTTVSPLGGSRDEGGEDDDKKAAEMFGLPGFVD